MLHLGSSVLSCEDSPAQYYGDRARRLRVLAKHFLFADLVFPGLKQRMHAVAAQFDRLADQHGRELPRKRSDVQGYLKPQ